MKIDPQILRQLRDERSWTQEHLADAAGVSLRTIQRIEREGNASADSRLALAAAFGVDVSVLAGKAEEPAIPPPSPATTDKPIPARPGSSAGGSVLRHLIVYVVVCSFLVFLDFSSGNEVHWSKWPILGWGFGLFMHALAVWTRPSGWAEGDRLDRKRRRGFPDRVRLYLAMSVMFLAIDYFADGKISWAFYPILGWGLGLFLSWGRRKTASEG